MNAEDNPFPVVPVARLSGSYDLFATGGSVAPGRPLTVETDAVRAVRHQLSGYLEQRVPSRGRALALVGDFGTGKSHIARGLALAVTADPSEPLLWLIDEPVWDFGAIYRDRLVSDLKDQKAAFYDVLLDYYADVTAESLDQARSLREVADGLRDRHLDPQAVIEAYALSEAAIRRDLERRLQVLTEHAKFARALALLQFPEFQDHVWEWLMGHPPGDVLRERGIDAPIDSVSSVFDALAVFAFLYGHAGRRFVFIVDMLEKVLDWPYDRRTDFMQNFEKLVNVYVSVGGLLVFCVLPEALSEFGESLHERILPIRPSPLTDDETVELVGRYLHPEEGAPPGDLSPFTRQSVRYIRKLAGGVPRRTLKLCHHAWEVAARGPRGVVDEVVVRTAVREAFEVATRDDIRASIEGILEAGAWRFERSETRFARRPGRDAEMVDYWILVGQSGSAVAVLTTDSVMLDDQVDRLKRVVEAARADTGSAPCEVLVVVNGYISAPLRQRLAGITVTQPIVYSDKHFRSTMRRAVADLVARLEASGRDSVLQVLRQRLEGIAYQQTAVLDCLQRVEGRVERLEGSTGARLGEVLQAVAEAGDLAAGDEGSAARVRLPQEVRRHFDRAFDAVGVMGGVPPAFRQVFGLDAAGPGDEGIRPRRLGFTSDQFQAVGVAVLLHKLLEAFRDSVGDWIRQAKPTPDGPAPTPAQERGLRAICRSYEITAEMLPVFRLESLAAFGPYAAEPGPLEQAYRSFHRAEAQEALIGLGERVFESAMTFVRS
ncbi:hypothetical protein [Sphaerisporangium fuscum]|uniref:hypothetical protein n=1 Tax=Sphaerisporangium fuscum TaxID=2835868 RepID=UPI001BDDB0E8|nr:hypothetical protein [Sphaerisporangium fuscum]